MSPAQAVEKSATPDVSDVSLKRSSDLTNEPTTGLQLSLQPVEFFNLKGQKVVSAVRAGGTTVVQAKRGDEIVVSLFDESGKRISLPNNFPPLAVRAGDVQNKFGSISYNTRSEGITFGAGPSGYKQIDEESCRSSLGLAGRNYELFKKRLCAATGKDSLTWAELKSALAEPFVRETELLAASRGNVVAFRLGNWITAYEALGKGGSELRPSEWQALSVQDLSQVTDNDIKKYPWLREFLPSQNGRILDRHDILLDDERGVLNLCDPNTKQVFYSDASVGSVESVLNPNQLFYVNPENRTINTVQLSSSSARKVDVVSRELPIKGKPVGFAMDSQGNFLIIPYRSAESEAYRMAVIEAESLEIVAELTNVKSVVNVDEAGRITVITGDDKLRLLNTNMKTFSSGALDDQRRERRSRLLSIASRLDQLELPKVPVGQTARSIAEMGEQEAFAALQERANEKILPEVQKADGISELQELQQKIARLAEQDEFSAFPQVFAGAEKAISEKMQAIRVDLLCQALDEIKNELGEAKDAVELVRIEREFHDLLRERRQLAIADITQRKAIGQNLREIHGQLSERMQGFREELGQTLKVQLEEIRSGVQDASTLAELQDAQKSDAFEEFDSLVSLLVDAEERRRWRDEKEKLFSDRREALQADERERVFQERMRTAEQIEELREVLDEISTQLMKEVTSESEMRTWLRRNSLVSRYRALALALPEGVQRAENERLDGLLDAHRKELEAKKGFQVPQAKSAVKFGKVGFPRYERAEVVWRPVVVPSKDDPSLGTLQFEDNNGRIFKPDVELVPTDTKDEATEKAIRKFRDEAEQYFSGFGHKVPQFNPNWVLNEHTAKYLEYMAHVLKIQVEDQAGILILEGDAGTGKNVLVDIFSHFTNRETMTFSCNFQTEKEDLTYAFHFDPKKGTYAVDSRLIEMLQTPGSVIVLDEINTLPPGVTKMLNPLLDYRRTLYLPDGREVKAHDSVVIVGTMNPQHYLGVKALSQEVISRSRVMNVDYPAEKRADGTWAPYEAEMLAKAFPRLQNFTHEEFERAWDFAINQKLDNEGDKLLDEATQADLKRLHRIVRSANRVREAYRAFHGGTSTDPLEFVFSIREGTQIASELRYQEDALRAIQDVVLPKIADPQEKKRVKTILENI